MFPDLSVIIVNWNVRERLRACLQSLARTRGDLAMEIIVVDSASADGSVAMLRAEFPAARLIACQRNVGFSAGNNLGLAEARAEHILCLNPDTEIVGAALLSLLQFLRAHDDVGLVAPQLISPDGRVQATRYRFPTLASALCDGTIVEHWFPHNRWLRRYHYADANDGVVQDVDWLMGACLLLRRKAIPPGGFDEQFFMYSEETDLCKRMKDAGWRVVYFPAAQVVHHHSQSSDQVVPLRHVRFQSSRVRYFRKHHGWLAAHLLRAFILFSYELLLLEESAKWLAGHKRPLRRERIRSYWQVLRSGPR